MWLAGLPAAVCGWKLEAVKHTGSNPPVLEGAGYNEVYTAAAGHMNIKTDCKAVRFFRLFSDNFAILLKVGSCPAERGHNLALAYRRPIQYNKSVCSGAVRLCRNGRTIEFERMNNKNERIERKENAKGRHFRNAQDRHGD